MKIGIIGGGFGVDGYLSAISGMEEFEIKGVSDSGSGNILKKLSDSTLYCPSWKDLLDPSVEAVCVVTPPAVQKEIVGEFLLNKKHVLCEKPFGTSLKDAIGMYKKSGAAGTVNAVAFQYRFEPGFQLIKRLLDNGNIGTLEHMECHWLTSTRRSQEIGWTWKNSISMGGGVINLFMTHVIDLFHWLGGGLVNCVQANSKILVTHRNSINGLLEVDAEDLVSAHMTLTNKLTTFCKISNCHVDNLGMHLLLKGSDGKLVYTHRPPYTSETQEVKISNLNGDSNQIFCAEDISKSNSDTRIESLRSILKLFASNIHGEINLDLPTFRTGLNNQRVLEGVRVSVKSSGTLEIINSEEYL